MAQKFGWRRNKEGPGTPAPTEGAASFFYQVTTYFWRFMTLNWLFLLASIPIITMPVALSAMNRVCIKLIRDRNVLVWAEFRDEFKLSFKKSLPMGLLFAALGFLAYYLIGLGVYHWGYAAGVLFISLGMFVLMFASVWGSYSFVLLASLDLSVPDLLRDARVLMFLGRKWTFRILGVLLGMFLILWLFAPISFIVPLIGGIALMQYTICWFVNEPMDEFILRPYETQRREQEKADQQNVD